VTNSARWKRYIVSLSDDQYAGLCARRAEYMREYWQRPEVKARRNERRKKIRARRHQPWRQLEQGAA
jgi:hypothetical protein